MLGPLTRGSPSYGKLRSATRSGSLMGADPPGREASGESAVLSLVRGGPVGPCALAWREPSAASEPPRGLP